MTSSISKISSPSIPKWIVLQLLEKCNLRCKMCYEWGETGAYLEKKELASLDIKVIKKIIADCQVVHPYYELFGGEPLLYEQIGEVISLIRTSGSKVDMATNGFLLEKKAEILVDADITRIWISLDGPPEINDVQRGKNTYTNAIEGISKIGEIKRIKNIGFPKVGITTIVTPHNYAELETFFFDLIGKCQVEYLSMEFQNFTTRPQYESYRLFLMENYGITYTPSAQGLLQDLENFKNIDTKLLAAQISRIKDYCLKNNITFFNNPGTIDSDNYHSYFSAHWDVMVDHREKCAFPWLHAEITAAGEVVMCHTFHDFTIGNVNQQSLLEIWNNERSKSFRKAIKNKLLSICTACSRYYTHTDSHQHA